MHSCGKFAKYSNNAVFGYGTSLPPNNNDLDEPSGSGKKVIFCVHGKLSGCCTIAKGCPVEGNNTRPEFQRSPSLYEDHCHRERNEKVDGKARKKLVIASILCVLFMIAEIIGGVLSSSLAIATDAAHLLTDFASFMISLFSIWVASRPATRKMPFGWYRAEVIGALTSVLMIWVVTGILIYLAVERIIHKDFEIDSTVMLITSAVGVAVNLLMGLTLHQHGHSHGGGTVKNHGHGHKPTENGSHGDNHKTNINVRAAMIHVIGDFIQSIGVFIAAIFIYYKPEWSIVDPICTFLFSALVLATTMAIMKDTINVLMEGTPAGLDYSQIENTFMQIEGVLKVHNLRIWALSLDKTALSAHLAIRPGKSPQEILRTATRNIHDMYDFLEMTLQIEEFNQKMENCHQCKSPPPL
ncbi:zinc transporter 2-like isoform X3 [Athalia rosae]|uniref:zinc transporter 2-like isoform X3 n=1 Tax=Athalia rosae TaxID=37344 RepID=UPI0020341AB4|nr:zinc transporter 2-like isoform X3 [Athalia rosae]